MQCPSTVLKWGIFWLERGGILIRVVLCKAVEDDQHQTLLKAVLILGFLDYCTYGWKMIVLCEMLIPVTKFAELWGNALAYQIWLSKLWVSIIIIIIMIIIIEVTSHLLKKKCIGSSLYRSKPQVMAAFRHDIWQERLKFKYFARTRSSDFVGTAMQ